MQHLRVVLSGSYASGGELLALAAVMPPLAVRLVSVSAWGCGPASSISANGGGYTFVPTATSLPSATVGGKLKIYATAGTEYSAGAYTADATTDIIFLDVLWSRN